MIIDVLEQSHALTYLQNVWTLPDHVLFWLHGSLQSGIGDYVWSVFYLWYLYITVIGSKTVRAAALHVV